MSTSKKIRNRLNGLFKNVIGSENDFVTLESKGALVEIPSDRENTPHPTFYQNQGIVVNRTSVLLEKSRDIDIQPSFSASTMNIPFQVGDEWNIIQLEKDLDRNWQSDEQILVSQIATQLGLALQNANLFEQTKITTQKLEAVAEIASQISSILELQPLLDTATRLTQQRFGLNHVHIYLFDKLFYAK